MSSRENAPQDLAAFIEVLRRLPQKFFEPGAGIVAARAPGRLDVMGGIADYSGSLVLQRPTAEATFAAVQMDDRPAVQIVSLSGDAERPLRIFSIDLWSLAPEGTPVEYTAAQLLFGKENHWAAYAAGVFPVLMRERGARFSRGSKILIWSQVPEGKGVASSAALEVAVMRAVACAFDIDVQPQEMAVLCQKVENLVAGAPCGVMDQMTSVCGESDSLLALLCQPAQLEPAVPIPPEIAFWGIDSGERHAVSGSDYRSVRTGAFMGLRLMTARARDRWNGYLANVSPPEFELEFLAHLPEEMKGAEFLSRYGATTDAVTTVDPSVTYMIRLPTAHPIYEHHRVKEFRRLLLGPSTEEQRKLLGELMYESHESYTACGLGSKGTDLLVQLVRSEGAAAGLYGARITGGGSGGTVAVLGRADSGAAIARIVGSYQRATGYRPYVFSGSSQGASRFQCVRLESPV